MKALLIHTDSSPYGRLGQVVPPSLLPAFGKSIVERQIEWAYHHGIREITVLALDRMDLIRPVLEDGERFGVELDLRTGSPSGDEVESLLMHKSLLKERWVVLPGFGLGEWDPSEAWELAGTSPAPFVAVCEESGGPLAAAVIGPDIANELEGQRGPLLEVLEAHRNDADEADLAGDEKSAQKTQKAQDIPESLAAQWYRSEGLLGVLEVNDALFKVPEMFHDASYREEQGAKGVFTGRGVSIHPTARIRGPVIIGDFCHIGADTEVGPYASLGENTVVAMGAKISHSLVTPGSYVGESIRLERCLTSQNKIFKTGSDAKVVITDPFLLGRSDGRPFSELAEELFQRTVGAVAMVALAPAALPKLLQAIREFGEPVEEVETLGSGEVERTEDLVYLPRIKRLKIPNADGLLAWWPDLINVVKGKVRLVGPKGLSEAEASELAEEWMLKRFSAPVGLIHPTFFMEEDNSARRIGEAVYAKRRSLGLDLRVLAARLTAPIGGKGLARRLIGKAGL